MSIQLVYIFLKFIKNVKIFKKLKDNKNCKKSLFFKEDQKKETLILFKKTTGFLKILRKRGKLKKKDL